MSSGGQLKQALPKRLAKTARDVRRAATLESGAARAGRIRVLIAEDNAINMKVACGILDRMGYKQARAPAACSGKTVDFADRGCCCSACLGKLSSQIGARSPPMQPLQATPPEHPHGADACSVSTRLC